MLSLPFIHPILCWVTRQVQRIVRRRSAKHQPKVCNEATRVLPIQRAFPDELRELLLALQPQSFHLWWSLEESRN